MKGYNIFSFVLLVLLTALLLLTGCSKEEETTLLDYKDDFRNVKSGWYVGESELEKYSYTDKNTYEIQVLDANLLPRALAPIPELSPRYTIGADIELTSEKGHCGLVFNNYTGGSYKDFYLFRLNAPEGTYKISRYNENVGEKEEKWTHLTGWKTCSANKDGLNTLKIAQNYKKASFYINDQLIEETDEISFHEDGISVGVFISSLNVDKDEELGLLEDPVTGEFDNYTVTGYILEEQSK